MDTANLIVLGPAVSAKRDLFLQLNSDYGCKRCVQPGNVLTVNLDKTHQAVIKDIYQQFIPAGALPAAKIINSYLNSAKQAVFFLCIDLSDEHSTACLDDWVKKIKQASPSSVIALVGFHDTQKTREIGILDFAKLAIENDCEAFIEIEKGDKGACTVLLRRVTQHFFLSKPEPAYEAIWQKAGYGFLKKAKSLLQSYTLERSQWKVAFHPKRHFRAEVRQLLKQVEKIPGGGEAMLFLLKELKSLTEIEPYGSLARRVAFIERKLHSIYLSSKDDRLILANLHKLEHHPVLRHMNDGEHYRRILSSC